MRRLNARAATNHSPNPVNSAFKTMDYSLKSLQFRPNPSSRHNSVSKFSNPTPKSRLLTLSVIAIALSIVFFVVCVYFGHKNPESSRKFGIIVDGGSTGSRVHVFKYWIEEGSPKFDFGPSGLSSLRVQPGLSSYANDPESAGRSLMELLEFGKSMVPKELWRNTEVRLMATAGLRLLDLKVQERILDSCRRVLKSSGFRFQDDWASVITGSDEGLYAWVVANYAIGSLGGHPYGTTGIIELGGASAQVTFVSREPVPSEFSRSLKYKNMTYKLYSHSFLHYGQNVAFDSVRESLASSSLKMAIGPGDEKLVLDPCTPKGYALDTDSWSISPGSAQKYASTFHARGNYSECRAAALTLLQSGKDKCSYRRCTLGSIFMPKLRGKFVATENFFHTSKFFGLAQKRYLSDLMAAGEEFCGKDWSNIKREHPSFDDEDLARYCFSSAYIVALLHDSLGMALDDGRITYSNQVDNIPLDWALGAFIIQSTAAIEAESPDWISDIISEDSHTLFLWLAAGAIVIFVVWSFSKWRKPYLKTIYDLEKGRYIVTRISR